MPIFISLIVASVLGALIGLERESAGKAAGLRTHLLAGVGAAAMIGMAAGFDAYAQAVFVTIIALVSLRGLRHLDAFLERQPQAHHLEVVWSDDAAKVDDVLEALAARGFPDHALEGAFVEEDRSGCRIKLRARKEEVPRIVFELGRSPRIREVRMV